MVMEFCSRGTLFDVLKNEKDVVDWKLAMKLATDSVRGIWCLHSWKPQVRKRKRKRERRKRKREKKRKKEKERERCCRLEISYEISYGFCERYLVSSFMETTGKKEKEKEREKKKERERERERERKKKV